MCGTLRKSRLSGSLKTREQRDDSGQIAESSPIGIEEAKEGVQQSEILYSLHSLLCHPKISQILALNLVNSSNTKFEK